MDAAQRDPMWVGCAAFFILRPDDALQEMAIDPTRSMERERSR